MTISNTVRTAGPFIGNGITADFPFAYKVFNRQDLLVAQTVISTGVETALTLDADYTVTLNGDQNSNPGGIIHMIAPPPVGTTLAATSNVSIVQNLDLTNNGGFYPKVINDALDRIVINVQQLAARVGLGSLNIGMAAAVAAVLGFIDKLASSLGASLVGFLQAGVGAVLRTLQDRLRERVSVKDFGAKGDGVTDDTTAVQAAATAAAGKRLYFPASASSYRLTKEISLPNNTTVCGDGRGSVIKISDPTKSGLFASGGSGIVVRDLVILAETAGPTAYVAGVYFFNSTKCKVIDVEFIGMTWAGVLLSNSTHCTVRGCRFSGWLGNIQDAADIMVYQRSHYNIIQSNDCYGGGDHGIAVFDPYANTSPTGNIIQGNVVGQHKAYGIMVYIALATTLPYDTLTIIDGNVVMDILGSGIAGSSGAGIYIQAGGGAVVTNNSVYNCCRQTVNFDTLAIAGIAVQIGETGSGLEVELTVSGNHVYSVRGPCLWAAASNRAININGNTFKSISVDAARGEAVILSNVKPVKFTNNTIRHENPNFYALKYVAIDGDYSYPDISDNTITCVNSAGGVMVQTTGAGAIANAKVSGNTITGSLANPAYFISGVSRLRFSNNSGTSSGLVFVLQNCQRARLSGNTLFSNMSGYSILFIGTNTGSNADETNDFDGGVENDAGNGMRITMFGDAAPSQTGLWDIGDTVINRSPSLTGQPDRWRCTAAGYPGTWKPVLLS